MENTNKKKQEKSAIDKSVDVLIIAGVNFITLQVVFATVKSIINFKNSLNGAPAPEIPVVNPAVPKAIGTVAGAFVEGMAEASKKED